MHTLKLEIENKSKKKRDKREASPVTREKMDDLRVFKSICGAASALPTYRAVLVTLFLKMFQKLLNSNAFFLCYLSMFIYAVVHNASLPQLKKKLECNCIIMRQIGEASYSLHKVGNKFKYQNY